MEINVYGLNYATKRNFFLTDVNLNIGSNKISAIIGNGKTTLLEILIGIRKINSGTILLDGKQLKTGDKKVLSQIAYIVENPETQFIYKNVYREFERITKDKEKHEHALEVVGLSPEVLNKNPQLLSNGEKRFVALALAILKEARLIIIDEPSLGLDYYSRKAMVKVLKKLKKEHETTIVLATNDVEFIHLVADHIFVLADNQLIFDGDKYKVFKEEEILAKYGIDVPKVIKFSNLVLEKKNIKLGYRDEINDLIKDIYRNAK